ncbi:MAG TPA: TetR/AcrR family transcriptional regulator [Solirubrobacteraceae bacterium]|nr:TetR/AcrR family transcriptional regulator [Solirubrobacteraceae bacterium]
MSGAQRREQLLDVTKAIAVDRGFHAVSIERVARDAGITRPIVYGHFQDLNGLLEALVEREAARALHQLTTILPVEPPPGDRRELLLAALQAYLQAAQSDPGTWRLVLMPPEGAPALLREHIARGRGAMVALLAEAVSPGLVPGREPPDPELTARMLSTIADEGVRLLLSDPARYPAERQVALARWLLGGLGRP